MVLKFKTNYPKEKIIFEQEPTFYINKITYGLYKLKICTKSEIVQQFRRCAFFAKDNPETIANDYINNFWRGIAPKVHTIRREGKTPWKGRLIHFYYEGIKRAEKFAPPVHCLSTQKIKIEYDHKKDQKQSRVNIIIDGHKLDYNEAQELAVNEGFKNLRDFLQFYDCNYKGIIIHWTPITYGPQNMTVTKFYRGNNIFKNNVEEIKVLQNTITEIKQTEAELLNRIIIDYLGREPTQKEKETFNKMLKVPVNPEKMEYYLKYGGEYLGTITGHTTKKGSILFEFNPAE